MEHKPIVEKLLAHYKDVYAQVAELDGYHAINILLEQTSTDFGICRCALEKFKTTIYNHDWVEKYGSFWGGLTNWRTKTRSTTLPPNPY